MVGELREVGTWYSDESEIYGEAFVEGEVRKFWTEEIEGVAMCRLMENGAHILISVTGEYLVLVYDTSGIVSEMNKNTGPRAFSLDDLTYIYVWAERGSKVIEGSKIVLTRRGGQI